MNKHVQGYAYGINQDISTNKYPNNNIYWAENFRVVSKDGLATGALTNVNGNSKVLSLGNDEERVVTMCLIRDTLIVFVGSTEGGKIYKWEHNNSDFETTSPTLVYTDPNLDFLTHADEMVAVGRYETPTIQKIYFTDGNTFFKQLNIIPEQGDSYPLTYDIRSLDLVPDITFGDITTQLETGGNLKAGRIQYTYQLYNKRGSESTISPESTLISLTDSSDTSSSSFNYTGNETGTSINKSVEVSITLNNTDNLFERIRVYALDYTVFNQIPAIRTVGEYEIDDDSVVILDSGQSIGDLTLEEFRFIQNDMFPKTIDIKDNILFAGNITQNSFRLTHDAFDTRAFRFNNSNTATVYEGANAYNITYTSGNLSTLPEYTHEAYNSFNSVEAVYSSTSSRSTIGEAAEENLFKYNPATGTLGGYGPNISYTFTTNKVLLDEGTNSIRGYLSAFPSITCEVGTRENYSNPYTSPGYQRDEVYRFAFVPIDKKGREGFAMWIGDIKFPNNAELPFIVHENNKTYANILGIDFTINIPTEVKDKISGYRIVRTSRTSSDKTIVTQGIIGYLANGGPDSSDKEHMMSQASVPLIGDMYNESPSYGRRTMNLALPGDDNNPSGDDEYTRQPNEDLPIESDGEKGFNPKFIELTSPEITFYKQNLTTDSAFIEAFGVLDENIYTAMSGPQGRVERNRNQLVSDKFKGYSSGNNNLRSRVFIKDNKTYIAREFKGATADPDNDITVNIVDEGRIFNNKTCNLVKTTDGVDYRRYGLRGAFNLSTVDSNYEDIDSNKLPLNDLYNGNNLEVVIANYKVNKGKSQYGGTSYEARSYNTYYPATAFVNKDTSNITVYNGDTYISFFTYARSLFGTADPADGDTIESYVFFPVESSINLELRTDNIQKYINWGWHGIDDKNGAPDYKIAETLEQGVLAYGTSYPQELGDLYRYNTAYSTFSKAKEYYPEPFDFEETEIYDTRITASDPKINGEYIDSWTKFKFNNYIDVDSKHNAITRILTFKNNLYYFQPTAVGIVSVNERSLLQDNQAKQLALGTGGILTRYDYITDKSGSEFYDGIIASDDSLFYADGRRKRINKLVPGKEQAVSVIKGIDSTLDKLPFNSVKVGFDRGYNEVVFAIDSVTVAFNETMDAFTSSYSFNPGTMISIGGDFYSTYPFDDESPWLYADPQVERVGYSGDTDADPEWDYILIGPGGQGEGLWKHNVGDPGVFYGGDGGAADSTLTLILNPNQNMVCYFDNLDLRTESTSNGVDDPDDVFYRFDASNNYQEISKELNFTINQNQHTGSIKRIGRVWRTSIMTTPPSGVSYSRMVDTYLKLKLYYDNSTGNKFRVHDTTLLYRPAKH